jgi:hypothetical protein
MSSNSHSGMCVLISPVWDEENMLSGKRKLVTSEEARFYARLLNRRMWSGLAAVWGQSSEGRAWSCN